MPFVSDDQRKFLNMNKPDVAKKFGKHTKKENIDGSLGDVYAVQKPYSGCQVGKLVTPFSPINGISMDQMPHDQVHGVYPNKDMAMSVANQLYEAHCQAEEALEEKKIAVTEKLKKAVTELEKMRSDSMGVIKENPKEAGPHKQKVAELTGKIDELMMKLETIEMSKKQLKNKEGKDAKKNIKNKNG